MFWYNRSAKKTTFYQQKPCTSENQMYKSNRNHQFSLSDFNQPVGLKMNPENRWVKKAATIPWADIEERYASLFPNNTGMPAKPLQTALGSLLIQKQYDYSDRELVEQIRENFSEVLADLLFICYSVIFSWKSPGILIHEDLR